MPSKQLSVCIQCGPRVRSAIDQIARERSITVSEAAIFYYSQTPSTPVISDLEKRITALEEWARMGGVL